jgi:hypothetical protein
MRIRLATLVIAAAAFTLTLPVTTGAQAGFWTNVAKGTVKNAVRHGKCAVKRAAHLDC